MSSPGTTRDPEQAGSRSSKLFWGLTFVLVVYVALCTRYRDNRLEADGWEHHRAIAALARDLRHPGNPTYAVDEPSIRYTPMAVALAATSRATGLDTWTLQSIQAVLNTLLMCLGVGALLQALGRFDVAGLALLVMVSLYGGDPAYANSYALDDLPWHEVNPSAFSFALVLFAWALLLGLRSRKIPKLVWVVLPLILGVSLLEHAMTGILGILGLGLFSILTGGGSTIDRSRRLVPVALVAGGAGVLCLAWPWYSFARAVLSRPDNDYWFNPAILRMMLTEWCAPAVFLSAWAITARDRTTVLLLLACGFTTLGLGVLAALGHSASLARLPLPGLVFFHLAIATACADHRVLSVRAWKERIQDLRVPSQRTASAAFTFAACGTVAYFLAPELAAIPREPYLARAYIAPLLHRPDKQPRLRETYGAVLAPVGEKEVVLAEPATAWPIPSFGPRIVAALHYEFFVPGQHEREADVARFFDTDDEIARLEILDRYRATWILLDESKLTDRQREMLLRKAAVEKRSGTLVLMRVARWRERMADHVLTSHDRGASTESGSRA
jgi:hypothetical protein